jgi:hypothetical protein
VRKAFFSSARSRITSVDPLQLRERELSRQLQWLTAVAGICCRVRGIRNVNPRAFFHRRRMNANYFRDGVLIAAS